MTPHALNGASFAGLRVGLLGGSFNPAHDGHLWISQQALGRLGLDQVWWLVSPQNPLKSHRGMMDLSARLAAARSLTKAHPKIKVTALETALGTRFTIDTVAALQQRFTKTRFVWLMGADNLRQLPQWHRWHALMQAVPVAVLARAPYSLRSLRGLAAHHYRQWRHPATAAGGLVNQPAPAWVFLPIPLHPASATAIRAAWADTAEHHHLTTKQHQPVSAA